MQFLVTNWDGGRRAEREPSKKKEAVMTDFFTSSGNPRARQHDLSRHEFT